jgi:MoaA/NifB/PqqE/SkfB family radical SAM enzyme
MSMVDSEEGAVIYQMNVASKYLIFPIRMSELQRKEHLGKLEVEARSLQHAIELGDPSLVKGVYDDNERKWLCKKCPYLEACTAIRKDHVNSVEAA